MTSPARRLDAGRIGRAELGRTAALLDGLRRTPWFRSLVPMEALVGWPLPVRERPSGDGPALVHLRVLLAGQHRPARRGEPTAVLPPIATITVEWPNGVLLEYSRHRPPDTPVGSFPHPAVHGFSTGDYLAARATLLRHYDELCESLATDEPFAAEAQFGALLCRLVEPGLEPFYRALAPEFTTRFLGATASGNATDRTEVPPA